MRPLHPPEHRASLRPWLPLLSGAALTGLRVSGLTVTEPPCAYVLGQVGDVTEARVFVQGPPEDSLSPPRITARK